MQLTIHQDAYSAAIPTKHTFVRDANGKWTTFVGVDVITNSETKEWLIDGTCDELTAIQEVPPWLSDILDAYAANDFRKNMFVLDSLGFRGITAPCRDDIVVLGAMAEAMKDLKEEKRRLAKEVEELRARVKELAAPRPSFATALQVFAPKTPG